MNILFISKDLACGDLCYRLKKEGNDVRLFIDDEDQKHNLDGMIEKTENWAEELEWVGKDGLIIFDSSGYGKEQDELRRKGYSVVGGNSFADMLEHDRQYGQKILSSCGIPISSSVNFSSSHDAIEFVKSNPDKWVIKQNGHVDKTFNYVGELETGEDVIELLEHYHVNNQEECKSIDLQKRIEGVEIGVGRYFNGNDWIGPIEFNIEHKSLFNGGLGPKTDEMGTLMWYSEDEDSRLFKTMLLPLENYLRKIEFKGDIEINCIINEQGAFPLEVTPRFGSPSTQLQAEICESPWGEFLKAVADGKPYDLKYKKGYAVIVLVATPPFPYGNMMAKSSKDNGKLLFREKISEAEKNSIHFEEVSLNDDNELFISSRNGYVLHVSGMGETVSEAQKKAYSLAEKIVIPKMFYRTDIGSRFELTDKAKLKKWGWI